MPLCRLCPPLRSYYPAFIRHVQLCSSFWFLRKQLLLYFFFRLLLLSRFFLASAYFSKPFTVRIGSRFCCAVSVGSASLFCGCCMYFLFLPLLFLAGLCSSRTFVTRCMFNCADLPFNRCCWELPICYL